MPAWLDLTLALGVVAAAVALLVHNVRRPRCASCPQVAAKPPGAGGAEASSAGPARVALGATRLGRRSRGAS